MASQDARATKVPLVAGFSPIRQKPMRMEQQRDRVRKTFKYKLMPTPEQERVLERVLWRCRELYNAGLQER